MRATLFSSYRYRIGEKTFTLALLCGSLVYLSSMVVLVLTSDQKSNNVQICTKQTYYLQEVLFHYNNKQVNKAKLLLI